MEEPDRPAVSTLAPLTPPALDHVVQGWAACGHLVQVAFHADESGRWDICRRLDGVPLAIELAAVRVAVLSVEQISERRSAPRAARPRPWF